MTIELTLRSGRLGEFAGHALWVYASVRLGKRTWWVQRWDTERCWAADQAEGRCRNTLLWGGEGKLMSWTAGRH